MNYKYLISEITSMFFRSKEFKIFEVEGGGYFVSLGLTTSFETMEKLKSVFIGSDYGFSSKIVELRSTKLGELEYRNVIEKEEGIEKYDSVLPEGSTIMREEARKIYPEISKSIEESPGGWKEHGILITPGKSPVVYYDKINYKKFEDGSELRIGIYVVREDNKSLDNNSSVMDVDE